jgi:adenylate cyclase
MRNVASPFAAVESRSPPSSGLAVTVRSVETYELAEAAGRIGIGVDALRRLVELGILSPDAGNRFAPGHLRRAGLVKSLAESGIPLEGLGAAIRTGQVSLDFLDAPAFTRFSALSGETFAQLAERTGVPVELLTVIREAAGSPAPLPDDRIRDEELPYAEFMELQVKAGFRAASIEQLLRVQGESVRRVAETESAVFESEVIRPAMAAGKRPDQAMGLEFGDRMSVLTERALIGMYRLRQTQAWTATILGGLEVMLAGAGLHSRLDHPPAMCFLDITGYTRLTQERGDAAAAQLAEQLGRVVQRTAVKHGGRAVKWLGDGVMLHFPNPGPGVVAALEMVAGATEAGLPPAHVGLHAGPVIFQEGDYYGQTVNVASRIADYARPGEVIVSQAVVDASAGAAVAFRDVGPVKLKGLSGAMRLHAASRPA